MIDPGDAVLFCGKGECLTKAIYFVSAPLTHSINYGRLARAIGFSPDFVVLGFMVLNEEKSGRVLHEFNLADD